MAQFEKQVDGTWADLDRAPSDWPWQCVDLVNLWCIVLGIEKFPGNASNFQFDSHPDCDWVPVGAPCQAADIIVWHVSFALPNGHVAVAVWGQAQQFASLDQNWPLRSNIHHELHTYDGVAGYLRPRVPSPPDCSALQAKLDQIKAVLA
jgi:hypothetical protein